MQKFILAPIIVLCLLPSLSRAQFFNINLDFSGGVGGAANEALFENAAATWESLIHGYLDTPGVNPAPGGGVTISATIEPIDGPGGILGSAGPTSGFAAGTGDHLYTQTGSMTFDSADGTPSQIVILHEMAHVLGIGTLWSSSAVGAPGFQELYDEVGAPGEYTGAEALAAYQQEFVGQSGATFVPVEEQGGPGTAHGHWDEGFGGGATGIVRVSDGADMNLMLMTGWANPGSFISETTLGSFRDLGYDAPSMMAAVPEAQTALPLLILGIAATYRMRRKNG